jgi:hypothetical protein
LQDTGHLLEPAGADTIGAFLVFLNLLKSQSERIAKFFLAQAQHQPAHPHSAAHVLVDWIRRLFHHLALPLPGRARPITAVAYARLQPDVSSTHAKNPADAVAVSDTAARHERVVPDQCSLPAPLYASTDG